jgi:YbgC/YbaW family acyl-CoA thioester hydrolase
MERVKINLPEIFNFKTEIAIRITDVNYGGHVGNDSLLSIIQEARLQFFKQYGYSEISIEGLGTIMADVSIEYKAEIFYGDVLEISVAIAGISRVGFDLFYLIEKKNIDTTILVAKAKTGILCFDYTARKVVSMHVTAIEKFNK